jgi:hypothetical protein
MRRRGRRRRRRGTEKERRSDWKGDCGNVCRGRKPGHELLGAFLFQGWLVVVLFSILISFLVWSFFLFYCYWWCRWQVCLLLRSPSLLGVNAKRLVQGQRLSIRLLLLLLLLLLLSLLLFLLLLWLVVP